MLQGRLDTHFGGAIANTEARAPVGHVSIYTTHDNTGRKKDGRIFLGASYTDLPSKSQVFR